MDVLQVFGMDPERCNGGVWVPFGDARLLIASSYSQRHQIAASAITRTVRLRAEKKLPPLTDGELLEMECRAYAETVLLGWEGITEGVDDDGKRKPLEPTLENRTRLLRDAPPFLIGVQNLARALEPYNPLRDEGALGNSERSSLGDSSGDRKTNNGSPGSQPSAP